MEKEKKRNEKWRRRRRKRWRISRADLRPRHRPAFLAPRGKLQPLAERPEEAAATGLTHEAKLQPLAEMMPEKLRQPEQTPTATAWIRRPLDADGSTEASARA